MRWKRRLTWQERLKAAVVWHRYFCWKPVTIGTERYWLTFVERQILPHKDDPEFRHPHLWTPKVFYRPRVKPFIKDETTQDRQAHKFRARYEKFV